MKNQNGFTLVELSIVIAVIGLITASIIAGNSLVRQAKLSRIISDGQKYQSAILAFKEKYATYPGDLSNATAYWPSAKNGNGNNKIEFRIASVDTYENVHLWNHLKLSGILDAGVTGTSSSANGVVGLDTPQAAIAGAGYWNEHLDTRSNNPAWKLLGSFGSRKITMIVGVPNTSNVYATSPYRTLLPSGMLTSAEAQSIDTKFDDGLPKTGDFMAAPVYNAGADTCYFDASNTYNVSGAANTAPTACYIGILY